MVKNKSKWPITKALAIGLRKPTCPKINAFIFVQVEPSNSAYNPRVLNKELQYHTFFIKNNSMPNTHFVKNHDNVL